MLQILLTLDGHYHGLSKMFSTNTHEAYTDCTISTLVQMFANNFSLKNIKQ